MGPHRIRWWKHKLEGNSTALVASAGGVALLPVEVTQCSSSKRGEPVAVYLRTGHRA